MRLHQNLLIILLVLSATLVTGCFKGQDHPITGVMDGLIFFLSFAYAKEICD
jgi:hypothetical protein